MGTSVGSGSLSVVSLTCYDSNHINKQCDSRSRPPKRRARNAREQCPKKHQELCSDLLGEIDLAAADLVTATGEKAPAFFGVILALLSLPFASSAAAPSEGKLLSESSCDVREGPGTGMFHRPLNDPSLHALEYRKLGRRQVVLLLSHDHDGCGEIVAALWLPRHRRGESIEFECGRKGAALDPAAHVIGLANNDKGRRKFAAARMAWKVDLDQNSFSRITGRVVCDTSGYAGDQAVSR